MYICYPQENKKNLCIKPPHTTLQQLPGYIISGKSKKELRL